MQSACDFLSLLIQNKLIEILTLILWGIYVGFTIKTFNQIKRQTELQSRSFLVVTPNFSDYLDGIVFTGEPNDMFIKWKQILNSNLPEVECKPQILRLKFTNRGKSDITQWELIVKVKVVAGVYLKNQFNTQGSNFEFSLKSQSSDIIPPGEFVDITVMPFGSYPQVIITWVIKYSDIMNGNYTSTNSENPLEILNSFAFKYVAQ
jgi:hypothetical protein